jgi:N-acetylmuramoyl-L-alanine amidase
LLDLSRVSINEFCDETRIAVTKFQGLRSLHVSGVCDRTTWLTLVESSFELGDRLLYLTSPLLRGDDVAQLQLLLSRIGFDCGRVDGFLGKITAKIITEFQQNYGLVPDGICGPQTLQAIHRASVTHRQSIRKILKTYASSSDNSPSLIDLQMNLPTDCVPNIQMLP